LGIWLSFAAATGKCPADRILLDLSVLIEHFAVATAALSAGRREAGVMAEPQAKYNRPRISQAVWGFSAGFREAAGSGTHPMA
jgi:hypothetical protein